MMGELRLPFSEAGFRNEMFAWTDTMEALMKCIQCLAPIIYCCLLPWHSAQAADAFPGEVWETISPSQAGFDVAKLDAIKELAGGDGCIVRKGKMVYSWGDPTQRGDVASACKAVLAHFLLYAINEKQIASVDEPILKFEPRLQDLNAKLDDKDRKITWRHLVNQISCYGSQEPPGTAFDYNDYNFALLFDTLLLKVYGTTWKTVDADVLRPVLTERLQCEDNPTFMAFGVNNRPGRLAISPRDFARFGLLYLTDGNWNGEQLLPAELVTLATTSPLPNSIPRTTGQTADMIPGQRTGGGGGNQTDHKGSYSFMWWTNGVDRNGKRHWPDAPHNTFGAFGHGGRRAMVVLPDQNVIISWNNTKIEGDEAENAALKLLVEACDDSHGDSRATADISPKTGTTILGRSGRHFTINETPTFLTGVSYYAGLGASNQILTQDLDDLQKAGVNWLRVWVTWDAYGENVSALDHGGEAREPSMQRLKNLVAECDRRGLIVDVTMARSKPSPNGPDSPHLPDQESHEQGVRTIISALSGHRNWYLDLANERDVGDSRFVAIDELKQLRQIAREMAPHLLVTASFGGHDLSEKDIRQIIEQVGGDFLAIHRPRHPGTAAETADETRKVINKLDRLGLNVPVHHQEPFRRGYTNWEPTADDFLTDLRGAITGGAAGWCFHNGSTRSTEDGRPRRSFDLRNHRLIEQLDEAEQELLRKLPEILQTSKPTSK